MTSFYSEDELREVGFASCGSDVLISRKVSIYGAENITIGSHVRIDDFCLLSGKIELKNYVHIAAYAALFGGAAGIYVDDYAGISARCCVYAASDDYTGKAMTNPTVPEEYRMVESAPVVLEKHVLVGAMSVVLPGVTLKEGSSFGAMSLIRKDSEPWCMYAGIPAKCIRARERNPIALAEELERRNG